STHWQPDALPPHPTLSPKELWGRGLSKRRATTRLAHSASTRARQRSTPSPIRRLVVLEKQAPDMLPGVAAADDRIDDACGAVDDVERWMEALLDHLARGDRGGILVGYPAG